jgi:hypothetical protein
MGAARTQVHEAFAYWFLPSSEALIQPYLWLKAFKQVIGS